MAGIDDAKDARRTSSPSPAPELPPALRTLFLSEPLLRGEESAPVDPEEEPGEKGRGSKAPRPG